MNLGDKNLKLYDNVFIMIKFLWNMFNCEYSKFK